MLNFLNRYGYVAINMQRSASGPLDTFECHNGHSTIDYITVPRYMMNSVSECFVNPWDALNTSDHRDVHITVTIPGKTTREDPVPSSGRIKWSKVGTKHQYRDNIAQPLSIFLAKLSRNQITSDNLNSYFAELTSILHCAASKLPRSAFSKAY